MMKSNGGTYTTKKYNLTTMSVKDTVTDVSVPTTGEFTFVATVMVRVALSGVTKSRYEITFENRLGIAPESISAKASFPYTSAPPP